MFQKIEVGLGPGGDLTCRGGGRKEAGSWSGGNRNRLRAPGLQQKKLAPQLWPWTPFPSGAPPWRCRPLSPLSSLSATLLVLCRCAPPHFLCMPVLPCTRGPEGRLWGVFALPEGFLSPHLFLL